MPDEMRFSPDARSLRRGRRRAIRTQICRPCLVWPAEADDGQLQGVALDISPFGMRVRMAETLTVGAEVRVQLMRDDNFTEPLAEPVVARVVRTSHRRDHFTDHGVELVRKTVARPKSRPVEIAKPTPQPTQRTRMHTLDITVGDKKRGR